MLECHPSIEQMKAEFIDLLYEQSGRDKLPNGHPLRRTYTGLWQEFCQQSAIEARAAWWEMRQFDLQALGR